MDMGFMLNILKQCWPMETYTGRTGWEFKDRWREHNHYIKKKAAKQPTRPSAHAWTLKDNATEFDIDWNIIERASPTALSPTNAGCV